MSEIYPEQPPVPAPGRGAYEAVRRAFPEDLWEPWEALTDEGHAGWAAVEQELADAALDESESTLPAQLAMARDAISDLAEERDEAREQLAAVYRERARLVSFLAACYPAVMLTDAAEPDWLIVFVSTPAGQLSWHVAATDTDLFRHVPSTTEPAWDGHTTEAKYERLADMTDRLARTGGAAGIVAASAQPRELAAAMAETRQLRDLAAEILAAFGPSGSGHTARVGQVQIRRWRERAGLEG